MFVEITQYFAKERRVDEVLEIRREACVVRASLGLATGLILTKDGGQEDGPDVAWRCHYSSREAFEQDLAARATSPAFQRVRQRMSLTVDRFERHLYQAEGDGGAEHNWFADKGSLTGIEIVPRVVTFDSGSERLTGYLYLPPGEGPFPCVVTSHGSGIEQGTNDLCRPGTASLLMSWGYASFLPHRRGYGESSGIPWDVEVSAEFGTDLYGRQLVARLGAESDDVVAAIDYVAQHPDIDAERIAVMGSSFGGTVTLWASTKSSEIRCAVDFAGASINWDHTPQLRQAMTDATHRIRCPIFFLQAANDYSVGPTVQLGALHDEVAQPICSKVFPAFGLSNDEGHYFERDGSLIWGPEVRAFFDRWLEG